MIVESNKRQPSRLEWVESSWIRSLSMVWWCWIYPLLSLGYKRQLTENDLDDIPRVDKSLILLDRLQSYNWSSTSTSKIICREFWKDYILASLFFFPLLIVRIAQPVLLRQIVLDMMVKQESNTFTYVWAISLFICLIIQTLANRQIIFRCTRVGLRIRNALTLIIYSNALSLKTVLWQQINTGQIINLIANDTFKFEKVCENLTYLIQGLIEAIILFGLLCWMISPIPTLCGYALFPFFILIQLYFSRKFGQQRGRTTKYTDRRVQAFSEFIHGCYIVKMYNWEKSLEDRIAEIRENELVHIRHTSRFRALNVTQFIIAAPLLAFITFGSAWLLNYPLNTANTFPILISFALMRVNVIYYLPMTIEKLSEAKFASERIDLFMRLNQNPQDQTSLFTSLIDLQQKGSIIISNAFFSWHNKKPCLSSLNIIIEQGTFVGVVGPVGSGKSSLFSAILGEMNLINGQINTNNSSFSYAAQLPWIFSNTIRNNILLNRLFDEERYKKILHACCLNVDFDLFGPCGDLTMIGEKGVNLSGGQKARISLARALYADTDIYLLDDPLSAVDPKVAKQIYEQCIGPHSFLKNKTRLLVTHQSQYLQESHQIIFLSHGQMNTEDCFNKNLIKGDDTNKNEASLSSDLTAQIKSVDDTQPIITDETCFNIGVRWSLWYRLFSAEPSGKFGFYLLILLLVLGEILNDGTNYWLTIWLQYSNTNDPRSSISAYVYFGLILITIFINIVRSNYYFTVILNGSNKFHNSMLKGLFYTSIQFFESNPSGRILNRVSKDQHVVDEILPPILLEALTTLLFASGSMFIICLIDSFLFFLLILLIPIVWLIIRFYQKSSLQLKQLESITHSSVYSLFSSSINGLTTIRAFNAKDTFMQLISDKIDTNACAYLSIQAASQWFTVTLNTTCCSILLIASIRIVFFRDEINLPTAALSLMSAMSVSAWFQWGVRQFCEASILMTSVKRIDEYSHLRCEDDRGGNKSLVKTLPTWPNCGIIEFRNYSLCHRFNSEYAIKNINLRIESGQKIGIIGRTGAGKSSLLKGIFRLVGRSCVVGEIFIDGIDISRITLNYLRSNLGVIPQQPILFSGTLRYNLDPFDDHSDEKCWLALTDVQLKEFVSNHSAGLLMSITESGNNLSIGQCQLICIARAILKNSKILFIDEATSNVDQKTDDLIQAVIKEKFQDRTVITIAHRLNTVAKCDRIIYLDKGKIVNYDTPTNIFESYYK